MSMVVDFNDYPFISDNARFGSSYSETNGGVEIPISVFGGFPPPEAIAVIDRAGREVEFTGGGQVFIVDSEAGTEEFIGWSYWEEYEEDGYDTPAVQLLVVPE
jgi:hypothetical protein